MSKTESLKATFKRWDTDGSGTISKDELYAIFKALDDKIDKSELDEMMNDADVNKDGKIDINEFINWCMGESMEMSVPTAEIWEEKLQMVKDEALQEFPGWLAKVEKHFTQLKERLSSEAFEKNVISMFMQGQDKDGDGLISYEEVKDLIEPTFEMLYRTNPRLKKNKVDEATLKAAFDAHDTAEAGKGKMGKSEFGNLFKYLQVLNNAAMMSDTVQNWADADAD